MTTTGFRDWTPDYFVANEPACKVVLEDARSLDEIPSLNSARLRDLRHGRLVKFRGMIQDMHDPEYYFERFEVANAETGESLMRNGMYVDSAECSDMHDPEYYFERFEVANAETGESLVRNGMYVDSAECSEDGVESIDMDSKRNKISERHTCVVISIPGLNDWAKEKKQISSEDSQSAPNATLKRELSKDEEMDCSEPERKKANLSTGENSVGTEPALSREHIMNFPIPNEDGKACIVKVYDDKVSYKLNEVVDIVGFISLDPMLSRIHSSDEMDDAEVQTHNPPASLVPRLHAVQIVEPKETEARRIGAREIFSKAESIRSDLHMVLSQLLFGDGLAADYLICHLISTVYMRKDHLCLGSFPLNITNFPIQKYGRFVKDLYQVISSLVPKSHYLECTLEGLNDMNLVPTKDYECNRLTSGVLQLSGNTHLVIDETGLTSGRVSASGRKNYAAISDLVEFQRVTYDFKYFTMEYETDIPVLILSEVKSFVPCITQVALKIDAESEDLYPRVVEAAQQYLRDEERLANIREYLRTLRKTDFQFGDEITDVIQEDFVKLRRSDKKFGADNLHSLMVLARLMSLSRGSDRLELECWNETVRMEMQRAERLPKRN